MHTIDLKQYPIQFITHQTTNYTYEESAELALKGGIRWIQLRMKEAPKEEVKEKAHRIKKLCEAYNALFFIDDYVDIAIEVGAHGVHLGLSDMPIMQAKQLTDNRLLIGATANTFDHIVMHANAGADYIGLGPYRTTTTKKHLSPILGLEGITDIINRCRNNKITLPIYLIGGIQINDIVDIKKMGVDGIAVSSAILQSENPLKTAEKFMVDYSK
ncbi:MAG: thiamine phosphate synthase [Bacteroidales bacterium]|jgi:thiamine-phosphate pyrophosphorylase|nr:thiamine phosphate synthase [Bacteroidales bacterium]MDD4581484.1 thiamine phosphate synthase [Bacteroidales bacterium]